MNKRSTLRLTPSNSPFSRSTAPRSPTKVAREEAGLRLKKVIGSTTASSHAFDCNPLKCQFAYAAGAAAVVVTIEDDGSLKHRFFLTKHSAFTETRELPSAAPNPCTPSELRNRTISNVRDRLHGGGSPLAASRDWSDSPAGKSSTAKDKVKAVTAVALSPNGEWLAVGETGFKPRVLIFGLRDGAADQPVDIISEHGFGVNALRFSPDSSCLASLGAVHDGFLHIWNIDEKTGCATLHASNKCTAVVNCMVWMGRALLTAGLRFVKIWRPDEDTDEEQRKHDTTLSPHTPKQRGTNRSSDFGNSILSPRHRVLAGKNALLRDLLNSNLVAATAISPGEALLFAEAGAVCLLDASGAAPALVWAGAVEFRICAAMLADRSTVIVMGPGGETATFGIRDLEQQSEPQAASDWGRLTLRSTSLPASDEDVRNPIAIATIGNHIIKLTRGGGIAVETSLGKQNRVEQLSTNLGAIAGLTAMPHGNREDSAFLTFAVNGVVQLWTADGQSTRQLRAPLGDEKEVCGIPDVLTAATAFRDKSARLATGDKVGILAVLDMDTGLVIQHARAHSSEIAEIHAFQHQNQHLLVTAGRDRTVQLFAWTDSGLELLQTMNEHAGAVNGLLSARNGHLLLSYSADRSIVVREALMREESAPLSLAYVTARTIALKAAPTSVTFGEDEDTLFVATTDRLIMKFNISSGQSLSSFKCSDLDGGESVIMSGIIFVPPSNGSAMIAGVSSTDKSVRLYSELGTLIARDWGHTEGITGLLMLPGSREGDTETSSSTLVTVAADSTMFLWDTTPDPSTAASLDAESGASLMSANSVFAAPPLRKVISHTELNRFRRESNAEIAEAQQTGSSSPMRTLSPQRLRKKPSRLAISQTPRLEPAFRSTFSPSERASRRTSSRHRSPSPNTSPKAAVKLEPGRRASMGMSMRSKSQEDVLKTLASPTSSTNGSLESSTNYICKALRNYRKKLMAAPASESLTPESMREVEKELKLTAKALGERAQGRTVDEATMTWLLDQASERIVGMLDERIRERVECEVRRGSGTLPSPDKAPEKDAMKNNGAEGDPDALIGALENMAVTEKEGS